MANAESLFYKILLYLMLLLISMITILPFLWMGSVSLKPAGQVYEYPPSFIPSSLKFENYQEAWSRANFNHYFTNTVIFAVVGTSLTVVFWKTKTINSSLSQIMASVPLAKPKSRPFLQNQSGESLRETITRMPSLSPLTLTMI